MNVSLTPTLEKLVQQQVESGLYNNASEVIRDALRLLKERQDMQRKKLKRLNAALKKGEDAYAAGDFVRLRSDEEIDAFFAKF